MRKRKHNVLNSDFGGFAKKALLGAALTSAISVGAMRGQAPQGTLIVVNQRTGTISLVDSASGKLVADIQEGTTAGHEVAVSPNGRTAYVPIYGDSSVGEPGTDGSKIIVLDLVARKIAGVIDLGHGMRPHGIAWNSRDGLLYLTAELDRAVIVVDPVGMKVVGKIPTGQDQSHMLVLSHDGRFGYTSNVKPGTVSVLDLKERQLLRVIKVSAAGVQRISITPDDKYVFTADQGSPRIAVINTRQGAVDKWIPLPAIGYGSAVLPDGKTLMMGLPSKNEVAVVDLASSTVSRVIVAGKRPNTVLLAPGGYAYVANIDSGVTQIDLKDWSSKPFLSSDGHADGIGWTPIKEGN